ncbi:hypothetical protein [Methanoculleus chikugoensis]|uniref:hypothetical protein n=1 Tax=Methanoculleus chikugoensis TaxID=118126 RepID=UPI0006D204DB|nr:hypothetical protein [Methanoculleus chikugoensis]
MNAVVRVVAERLGVEYAKVLRYLPREDLFILEAAVGGFGGVQIGTEKVNGGEPIPRRDTPFSPTSR